MNIFRLRPPFQLIGILSCGVALSACQNSGARTAEMSQETMVLDTIGNGTGRTPPGDEGGGMPEGIGREGGAFYYIRNGQATLLTQRERFAQGVSYERGHVILCSGSVVRLREGEMVTFAGEHLDVPPATIFSEPTPVPRKRIAAIGR